MWRKWNRGSCQFTVVSPQKWSNYSVHGMPVLQSTKGKFGAALMALGLIVFRTRDITGFKSYWFSVAYLVMFSAALILNGVAMHEEKSAKEKRLPAASR
jgi:hypothetical protein